MRNNHIYCHVEVIRNYSPSEIYTFNPTPQHYDCRRKCISHTQLAHIIIITELRLQGSLATQHVLCSLVTFAD
jgi:hypothetical protein